MLRRACAVLGGLLLALPTAAGVAAAPAGAAGPEPTLVTFSNGVVRWAITATGSTGARRLERARPCLSLRTRDGDRTRACMASADRIKVVRPDGSSYRVPATTRRAPRGWRVRVRQADLAPVPGATVAVTRCRADGCDRQRAQVTVPQLRLTACRAHRPWLVHEGVPGRGRAVALTFDDGPGLDTRPVLRTLRDHRATATFFEVGRMVEQDPRVLRRIVAGGHAIGNHSYSHPVLTGADRHELARTNRAIVRAGAPRPCLFRAPYGENPPDVVSLARGMRMVTVNWNTDPGDWRGLSADQIVAATLAQTRPGSILVFHDGGDRPATLRALPRILTALEERGYRFLSVPELLRLPMTYR